MQQLPGWWPGQAGTSCMDPVPSSHPPVVVRFWCRPRHWTVVLNRIKAQSNAAVEYKLPNILIYINTPINNGKSESMLQTRVALRYVCPLFSCSSTSPPITYTYQHWSCMAMNVCTFIKPWTALVLSVDLASRESSTQSIGNNRMKHCTKQIK